MLEKQTHTQDPVYNSNLVTLDKTSHSLNGHYCNNITHYQLKKLVHLEDRRDYSQITKVANKSYTKIAATSGN